MHWCGNDSTKCIEIDPADVGIGDLSIRIGGTPGMVEKLLPLRSVPRESGGEAGNAGGAEGEEAAEADSEEDASHTCTAPSAAR
jgi:hypothetical protein